MQDLAVHLKDNIGLVAIAVGLAEGTRRKDGAFTPAFWGHTDPGNQRRNLGSFSYQGAASGALDADRKQLNKLARQVIPAFEIAVPLHRFQSEQYRLLLFVTACDVFVQSEAACLAEQGFLDLMSADPKRNIIEARVGAYYDPITKQLDAPGFGNDRAVLKADQTRRQQCIDEVFNAYKG